MKLLKLRIDGLDLYKEGLELCFVAEQRVTEDNHNSLKLLFDNIYKKNIVSIIGINASGKTTALKILSMIVDIYLKNSNINNEEFANLLNGDQYTIEAYFYKSNSKIIKIWSKICREKHGELFFEEEKLWIKGESAVLSKKRLFEFDDKYLKIIRSKENSPYLANYSSIMISQMDEKNKLPLVQNLIGDTNLNIMRVSGGIPIEIVGFLDNSIEYISEEDNKDNSYIRLKFKNQPQEIHLDNRLHLASYLSSGTIKGLNVFAAIQKVLLSGGMLIIDELENHFNREIVRTILELFKNPKINLLGATIVFTTHYPELLDEFERNDTIYFAFKDETLKLENLSKLLKRSDYKKSEVYQSSYLGNTAPSYDAYMNLRHYFQNISKKYISQKLFRNSKAEMIKETNQDD